MSVVLCKPLEPWIRMGIFGVVVHFVAGAIFSGFAMVQTLLIIMRKVINLENYITIQHIELMNIVIMITGSIVGVAYITELFIAWYSGVDVSPGLSVP